MNKSIRARLLQWKNILLAAMLIALSQGGAAPQPVSAASGPTSGIVCTTNPTSTFTLTTQTGYIALPDGNTAFMWGLSNGNEDFQYPGPVLCVNENDTVTIVLHNTLPEPVSLIFPGQEDVLADGAPSQPVDNSLARPAPSNGTVTYTFQVKRPGTYLYESGTNPEMQVQMGLFGTLVVRPAGHADWAYDQPSTQFNPNTEFLNLLSEIDPALHAAVEKGQPYNINQYLPRYWLINGRGFPDTVAPNFASWLPSQPYGSLVHVKQYDASANPLPVMVRYLSVGPEIYHFHPHGFNGRIIARDGHQLVGPSGQDISFEKFSIPLGPGQTWDSQFTWKNVDGFDQTTNPVPVTVPPETDVTLGQFFSGSPYLGTTEVLPPGALSFNQCGEYYHIAHNHDLYKITSWGITMTGQITYTRIDPLTGCQ